jgi:hypothetical protein
MAVNNNEKIIVSIGADTTGLKEAGQELDNLQDKVEEVGNTSLPTKSFDGFKKQLREARLEAERVLQTFGENSPEYKNALKGINEITNTYDDFKRNIQTSNPDKPFQALVGAGTAATKSIQGVTALVQGLGFSSKSAEEQIARLQAIMAFGDALNSLDDITDGFKDFGQQIVQSTAFQKANNVVTKLSAGVMGLFSTSVDTTSTSFKVLKGAIAATGIGLLVVGVTSLIQNFDSLKNSGGLVGTVLTGLSDAVGFLTDGITSLARSIGLIGEEDTNQADIAQQNAERVKSAKENIYQNELKIAQATGKGVEEIEKRKRDEVLKTLKLQEQGARLLLDNPILRRVLGEEFINSALTEIQNQIRDLETDNKVADIERTKREKESSKKSIDNKKNEVNKKKELSEELRRARLSEYDREIEDLDKLNKERVKVAGNDKELLLKIEEDYWIRFNDIRNKYRENGTLNDTPSETPVVSGRTVSTVSLPFNDGIAKANQEFLDRLNEQKDAEDTILNQRTQAYQDMASNVVNILQQLGGKSKAAAVAAIIIDSVQSIFSIISKTKETNMILTAQALKFPALAPRVAVLKTLNVINAGLNIAAVTKAKAQALSQLGGSGGGGSASAPATDGSQASAPQITASETQTPQNVRVTNDNQNDPIRAIVVDRDIQNQQKKRERLNQLSTFG